MSWKWTASFSIGTTAITAKSIGTTLPEHSTMSMKQYKCKDNIPDTNNKFSVKYNKKTLCFSFIHLIKFILRKVCNLFIEHRSVKLPKFRTHITCYLVCQLQLCHRGRFQSNPYHIVL